MNRFLRVWAASFNVRTAIWLAILGVMTLLAFALTVDPVIIALAAAASTIGIVIYARSKEQGIDISLLSGSAMEEDRFLSFQLACGMDRKEYVDAYSWLFLAFLPLIFMLFLVLMWTMLGDPFKSVESALTLTLLMVPLFYMIIHHNVCALAGHDRPARFLASLMLYLLFFLGVLVGLVALMDAPLLGMVVSAALGLAVAIFLRSRSIEVMMKADIR